MVKQKSDNLIFIITENFEMIVILINLYGLRHNITHYFLIQIFFVKEHIFEKNNISMSKTNIKIRKSLYH